MECTDDDIGFPFLQVVENLFNLVVKPDIYLRALDICDHIGADLTNANWHLRSMQTPCRMPQVTQSNFDFLAVIMLN